MSLESASAVILRSAWHRSRWLMTQANWLLFIRNLSPASTGSLVAQMWLMTLITMSLLISKPWSLSMRLWLISCIHTPLARVHVTSLSSLMFAARVLQASYPQPSPSIWAYWLPPLFPQYFNWRLLGWIWMSLHGLHFSLSSLYNSFRSQIHWFREISAEWAAEFCWNSGA